jgi:hypothetical protein
VLNIDREHPDYKIKRSVWRRYRDLYAGGEQMIRRAGEYLTPRLREPIEVYNERLAHAFYENYIGSIVDWYAATLFHQEPVITMQGPDAAIRFFNAFIEDANLQGTTLNEVLRRQFIEAVIYGASYLLVDFPKRTRPAGNRAEEEASGASRAYVVTYSPENLINWSRDDRGAFEWAVLRSEAIRTDGVDDEEWTREVRWTYYDRQEYRTFRKSEKRSETGSVELVDQGMHGLAKQNRVPLFALEIPEGLWLLNRAGSLQMEHFNKSNALSWALTMGLFAMPVVYSDRKFNQMVGESYYIQLGPADKFGWTEPEGRVYEIAANNLVQLQEEIYRICYLNAIGGSLDRSQNQSALSKQRDFSVAQDVLEAYGDSVKDFARRVLMAINGAREDGAEIDVSGMDQFDIADFSSDLADAQHLLSMGIPSPTLKKQVLKQLALKYLCDTRQSIKNQVDAEIEAAVFEA